MNPLTRTRYFEPGPELKLRTLPLAIDWRGRALTAEAELEKLKAARSQRMTKYNRFRNEVRRLNKAIRLLGLEYKEKANWATQLKEQNTALLDTIVKLLKEKKGYSGS